MLWRSYIQTDFVQPGLGTVPPSGILISAADVAVPGSDSLSLFDLSFLSPLATEKRGKERSQC